MDRSLPGSSVRGIFQARVLEWVTLLWGTPYGVNLNCFLPAASLVSPAQVKILKGIGLVPHTCDHKNTTLS